MFYIVSFRIFRETRSQRPTTPRLGEHVMISANVKSAIRCHQISGPIRAYDASAPARQAEANEAHRKFMEVQRRKVEERNARRRAGNRD